VTSNEPKAGPGRGRLVSWDATDGLGAERVAGWSTPKRDAHPPVLPLIDQVARAASRVALQCLMALPSQRHSMLRGAEVEPVHRAVGVIHRDSMRIWS
jgi:hypothetical protein